MSDVYGASSRGKKLQNEDGTWNVYCKHCRRLIARVPVILGSAICAMCDAALNGQPIPEEALLAYQAGKPDAGSIGLLVVPKDQLPQVDGVSAPSPLVMFGQGFRAVGRLALSITARVAGKRKAQDAPASAKIAQSKRRKRIFEDIDLEKQ